ncbi:MAG: TonB-dependent receptor [Gemmatimonadaceae bacterium]|nr:TonB-dependent receptor [Gemmatimonadaceae bacterium]
MSQQQSSPAARWRRVVRASRTLAGGALIALGGVITLAGPGPLHAQATGTIEGRVTAAVGGAPLSNVVVRVDSSTGGTLTDAEGRYRIPGLAPGSHTLTAQRIGLSPARQAVTVAAGATVHADFALRETAAVLEPLVVSATREAEQRSNAAATIDVLDGAAVRQSRAAHPNEIMNRMPGVHMIELSGEGHMTAIRQPITTKPVYLYLEDGVPTRATGFFNHNALYEVNIPQSGGIEVLKGPGTALYGSDAIGGVVNVLTRPAPPRPTFDLSLEGGAKGWGRLLATGGTTAGANGVRADLNLTRTDGWRDASGYTRQSGTVRWDHDGGHGWHAKTVLTGSNVRQSDAYTVDAAQLAAGDPINLSPIAFRRVKALRLSSAIEKESGPSLWSITPYARYDVLDLLPYWQLTYDPQLWSTTNHSLGVLAKYRRDLSPLRARLIVGADGDWSPGSFTADRVIATREGPNQVFASYVTGERQYDYDVTYRAVSPYAQLELSPVERVRVDVGVRYDVAGYVYRNHLPVDESPSSVHKRPADTTVSYEHLSPKLGLTLDVAPGVNAFVSYRHGFRAPSQGQLFQQGSALNTVGLRPVRVDSYETGVRGGFGGRMVYEVSLYDMTITDDILTFVTAQNTREAVNAGKSRYRGIEAGVGVAVLPSLRVDASYAVTSQRYVRYVPQAAQPAHDSVPAKPAVDYSGNRVEQAPRDLANVLVTWSPRALRGGRIGMEYNHTGRYAEDAANTHFYPGYDLVNVSVNYLLRANAELFARAVNVLDRRYAELASYDPFQRDRYNPGSPRMIYAGVHYTWER